MLSKAEIKVLRYLHKLGKDTVIDPSHPPFKLSGITNFSDVLKSLRQKSLIAEIGAKDVRFPWDAHIEHIGTGHFKIMPDGIAELEHIPIDLRRMWIPVIFSTVLSIVAIIISIIALAKQ